jgi:hypothetical protein
MVLLVVGYEHSQDVSHQVRAALRHAVQEQRRFQRSEVELLSEFLQVVSFGDDARHAVYPSMAMALSV